MGAASVLLGLGLYWLAVMSTSATKKSSQPQVNWQDLQLTITTSWLPSWKSLPGSSIDNNSVTNNNRNAAQQQQKIS